MHIAANTEDVLATQKNKTSITVIKSSYEGSVFYAKMQSFSPNQSTTFLMLTSRLNEKCTEQHTKSFCSSVSNDLRLAV